MQLLPTSPNSKKYVWVTMHIMIHFVTVLIGFSPIRRHSVTSNTWDCGNTVSTSSDTHTISLTSCLMDVTTFLVRSIMSFGNGFYQVSDCSSVLTGYLMVMFGLIWLLQKDVQHYCIYSVSTVRIGTGYIFVEEGFSSLRVVHTRSGAHPASYPIGSLPRVKGAGVWIQSPTFNSCQGQEYMDLYIYSFMLLHGIVLNYLSLGRNKITNYKGQRTDCDDQKTTI
jgi:hypothetical protein